MSLSLDDAIKKYYVAFLDSSRPLGDVFWNFVFGMIADVFGLSFSYLEHHPWLRFLVNKPEIATAPISCQLSGYLFIATQKNTLPRNVACDIMKL